MVETNQNLFVWIDDDLVEALEHFYLHEYYCEGIETLMKESLNLLYSARKELEQEKSELFRRRKAKRFIKTLSEKSYELHDLVVDLFQATVRAVAEIQERLISLEVQEDLEKQNKKLDSFIKV